MHQACQTAGFIPQTEFTTHRTDNIINMVSVNGCVALFMNYHASYPVQLTPPKQLIVIVDIQPHICFRISLCYLKNEPLSSTAQQFVDYCREEFLKKP